MNKEKTLSVAKKDSKHQEAAYAKNGCGDTSNASNDVISATTFIIGHATSSTTKFRDIYFYGVGAILLATGVCALL